MISCCYSFNKDDRFMRLWLVTEHWLSLTIKFNVEALQCNKERVIQSYRGEESQIFRESFEGWIKRVDTIDNDIEENVGEVSDIERKFSYVND